MKIRIRWTPKEDATILKEVQKYPLGPFIHLFVDHNYVYNTGICMFLLIFTYLK